MKRLSLLMILGFVLSLGMFAQSAPREEGAGSSFLANDSWNMEYVNSVIAQNPGYSGAPGQEGAGSLFMPFAQQVQAVVPVTTEIVTELGGQKSR